MHRVLPDAQASVQVGRETTTAKPPLASNRCFTLAIVNLRWSPCEELVRPGSLTYADVASTPSRISQCECVDATNVEDVLLPCASPRKITTLLGPMALTSPHHVSVCAFPCTPR